VPAARPGKDYTTRTCFTERRPRQTPGKRQPWNVTAATNAGEGKSDVPSLIMAFLTLSEHPRADWNGTLADSPGHPARRQTAASTGRIRHRRHKDSDGFQQAYRNQSPPRLGCYVQTATEPPTTQGTRQPDCSRHRSEVKRFTGDEIWRSQGPVHWDVKAKADDRRSCWLEVSISWAGKPLRR